MTDPRPTEVQLREIDARVYEHVFGRERIPGDAWHPEGYWRIHPGDNAMSRIPIDFVDVPRYTTSWEAAGQVVERMWSLGYEWMHLSRQGPKAPWQADFIHRDPGHGALAQADTFPLAVCLAALNALGVPGEVG